MLLYHVSIEVENKIKTFIPRVPNDQNNTLEDNTIERICFAPSILQAISASPNKNINETIMVFTIDHDSIPKENLITPEYLYENNLVYDAIYHEEYWVINQSLTLTGIPINVTNVEFDYLTFAYDTKENRDFIFNLYKDRVPMELLSKAIKEESIFNLLNNFKYNNIPEIPENRICFTFPLDDNNFVDTSVMYKAIINGIEEQIPYENGIYRV